jgi:hypothetical protein
VSGERIAWTDPLLRRVSPVGGRAGPCRSTDGSVDATGAGMNATARAATAEARLKDHVERIALDQPPIDVASVDFTVRNPALLRDRFGPVLSYMARVELEVERNVLELETLIPDPPEIDRHFYRDVWGPQEERHGLILDELHRQLGGMSEPADLTTVGAKLKVLGAVGQLGSIQDVSRMLYYLTGVATERSAVLAYNLLYDGVLELGEAAVAHTVLAPIRRQEPGHYAFYLMSARSLWVELSAWQRWLVRRMRSHSFSPVGVNNDGQRAQFGEVMMRLGIDRELDSFASQVVRAERDLLWARAHGLQVPEYAIRAFRDAVLLAQAADSDGAVARGPIAPARGPAPSTVAS